MNSPRPSCIERDIRKLDALIDSFIFTRWRKGRKRRTLNRVECFSVVCMVILSKAAIHVTSFCPITHVCISFMIYYRLELLNKARKEGIPTGTCSVNHLAVDPCFRRKGIGKILLNTAEKDALRHGCSVSSDFSIIYSLRTMQINVAYCE